MFKNIISDTPRSCTRRYLAVAATADATNDARLASVNDTDDHTKQSSIASSHCVNDVPYASSHAADDDDDAAAEVDDDDIDDDAASGAFSLLLSAAKMEARRIAKVMTSIW